VTGQSISCFQSRGPSSLALLSRCTLTDAVCFHDVAKDAMRTSLDCMMPVVFPMRDHNSVSLICATVSALQPVSCKLGNAPVGAIAGARNGRGYHQIRIGGRPYSASRLAWLYMTGKWPNSEISYINGKPSDTRWANLREVTSSQNRSRPKSK
jgi:hypothetical protein